MAGTSEQLGWVFDLVDKYTANADRMTKSTDAFEASLKRAGSSLTDVEKAGRRTGSSFAGWSGAWGVSVGALKQVASWALTAAEGIGDLAWEAGKFFVSTLAFKENTLVSFELMLGDAQKAKELYRDAALFAKLTPFETKDVVGGFQRLISAGFNIDQTKVLFQALGDVAATAGERGTESFNHLVMVMGHLRAMPKVTAMEFKELSYWSSTMGVGMSQIMESYAKARHITMAQAMAEHNSGAMNSEALIYAFTDAIRVKTGGKVGQLQLNQSHTITGLLSTLKSAPFDFINTIDPSKSRGLQAFKGFLENLVTLFDTGSSAGQRFANLVDRVFNESFGDLFESLSGPEGMHKLDEFFSHVIDTTGKLYDVTSKFIGLLGHLAPSLQSIESVLDRLNKVADEGLVAPNSPLARAWAAQAKVGKVAADILVPDAPTDANSVDGLLNRIRTKPITSSQLGYLDEAEMQSKAYGEAITAGAAYSNIGDSVSAPRRAGGSGVVVHLNVNVDASSVTDPAGIVAAIKEMLPAELEHLFQRLATETGSG